jgi:hypothetical protein
MNGGPGRPTEKNVELGRVLATPGVLAAVARDEILAALARHARGDWGEVSVADWQETSSRTRGACVSCPRTRARAPRSSG